MRRREKKKHDRLLRLQLIVLALQLVKVLADILLMIISRLLRD